MKFLQNINTPKASVMLGFAALYSAVSLVNHYFFRTYAYDLGIYNQAMWDYAHFRINNNTVLEPCFGNILSSHFELLIIIFSPLYYLFGSFTLLLVQIAAIIFGGQGIYKYVELINSNRKSALAAMLQFFLFFGIYSALAFDYHNNVVGAMLVPWIFYFIQKNKLKQTVLFFILFLVSKENMALWGFFLFAGIAVMHRKDRKKLTFSAICCLISLLYFLLIVEFVIPALSKTSADYGQFARYSAIGTDFQDALNTLLTSPVYVFKLLFINHLGIDKSDYLKAELHIAVLLSGVIFLFYRPYYLLMLFPVYAQKMFSNDSALWGTAGHYSIEFIPVITIGAFTIISEIDSAKKRRIFAYSLIILTAAVSFRMFDNTFTHFRRENQRFYQERHYTRAFSISEAHKALALIPPNAAVSAQDEFVSHLCFRKKIYLFPAIQDAQYIFLCSKAGFYPFKSENEFAHKVNDIDVSGKWEKIYDENFIVIYKKIQIPA